MRELPRPRCLAGCGEGGLEEADLGLNSAVLLQAVGQTARSPGGFLFCKCLQIQARRPVEEMLGFFSPSEAMR